MPKKDTRSTSVIPRLLSLAFMHANQGNEAKAWEHWETAVSYGYRAAPKTMRQLKITINQWRRSNGLVEHKIE